MTRVDCPDCDGCGTVCEDEADYRGEHVSREYECSTCDGVGRVDDSDPADEMRDEYARQASSMNAPLDRWRAAELDRAFANERGWSE
jgi:DnaJ-class molecular chaperone